MKPIKCQYINQDFGVTARLFYGKRLILSEDYPGVKEAVQYTEAFCEGFRKAEDLLK